jgi:hypothetical protein
MVVIELANAATTARVIAASGMSLQSKSPPCKAPRLGPAHHPMSLLSHRCHIHHHSATIRWTAPSDIEREANHTRDGR